MRPAFPPEPVAFLTGAAVMALELLLPRRVAPHIGVGIVAWTSTFAVVLGGLAIGNAIGGRLADARRGPRVDAAVLVAAALLVLGVPTLDAISSRALAALPLLPRAVLGLACTALPVTIVLGMVSPLLTADALDRTVQPGRVLGRLAAFGAAGSLVGTYAAGFFLIPTFATSTAIHGLAILLAAAAAGRFFFAGSAPTPHASAPLVPIAAPTDSTSAPTTAEDPLSRRLAIALAFASGLALLVLEVVAGRTASRLVGNGLYTWTAVIGAVLLGLVVGNAIGGRLASRAALRPALASTLLVASVLVMAAAWTPAALGVLGREPGDSLPLRLALGTVLAWLLPAAALGALPPVLARAALRRDGRDGRTVGLIYAAQTVGAVLGSLITSPALVPLAGTSGALAATALGLALLPRTLGRRIEIPWVGGLVLVLLVCTLDVGVATTVGRRMALREDADAVLLEESPYGQVRVDVPAEASGLHRPRVRRLRIDGFVHGYADLDDPDWLGYGYEGVYAAVTERVLKPGHAPRALVLGGGACTFPHWMIRHRPGAVVDVAEIDPAVTRAARTAMGLPSLPGLHVIHEDARTFVRDLPADAPRYDLVFGDAFNDLSVPWHLATLEFTKAVHDHMAPGGVYLVNVVDAVSSGLFLGALATTLSHAFEHVTLLGMSVPGERQELFVLVASDRVLDLQGLQRKDPLSPDGKGMVPVLRWTDEDLTGFMKRAGNLVLTDDDAPVESLLAPVVRLRTRQ